MFALLKDKINSYKDSRQRRKYLQDKVNDGEVAIPLERFVTKFVQREGEVILEKIAKGEATEADLMRYRILSDVKAELDGIIRTAKMKHEALRKMEGNQ